MIREKIILIAGKLCFPSSSTIRDSLTRHYWHLFIFCGNTTETGKKDFLVNFFWSILFHTFSFAVTAIAMMNTFQKLQRSV